MFDNVQCEEYFIQDDAELEEWAMTEVLDVISGEVY